MTEDEAYARVDRASLEPRVSQRTISERVLEKYQDLRDLYAKRKLEDCREEVEREIEHCNTSIFELEKLEALEVKALLDARLNLPLGEEARLTEATSALLRKYGEAPSEA